MRKLANHFILLTVIPFFSSGINYAQSGTANIVHQTHVDMELIAPIRLGIDGADNIYVTESGQKSIIKYEASGSFLEKVTLTETPLSIANTMNNETFIGTEEGHILQLNPDGSTTVFYSGTIAPVSMDFSPEGLLYVVDGKAKEVIVLDVSATMVQTLGPGTLIQPSCIVYDKRTERILIGEHGGLGDGFTADCKVWVFNKQGVNITSFGAGGNGDGKFYRIQAVEVGKCGNIYVLDAFQGNVSVFDPDYNFLFKFGSYGDSISQLNIPLALVFDSQERILITSMNTGALEIFNITDTLPTSNIANCDTVICAGNSATIEVSFTGTTPWDFTYTRDGIDTVWIANVTGSPYIITATEGGIYEVIGLSDANYTGTCFSGSAVIQIDSTVPTSSIMIGDQTVCANETIDIPIQFTGTSPWTFTYTRDGTNPSSILTSNNPYVLTVSEAGLYQVEALKGVACSGSVFTGTINFSKISVPTATFTVGTVDVVICEGESADLNIELTGYPPWSFSYSIDKDQYFTVSNTSTNPYIVGATESGVYELETISDLNCFNRYGRNYPHVIVKPLSTASKIAEDASICSGESVAIPIFLSGSPPWTLSYEVDTLMTTTIYNTYSNPMIINAIYDGYYFLNEVSDINCTGTIIDNSTLVTVNPLPSSSFSFFDNSLEVSFVNTSTGATSYTWDFGDSQTSFDPYPIHVYASYGTYIVSLTASNTECGENTNTDTVNITILGAVNINLDNTFRLYPNPTAGLITLKIDNPDLHELTVEIINSTGQKIFSTGFSTPKTSEYIDMSTFSKGIYTVKLTATNLIKTAQVILTE